MHVHSLCFACLVFNSNLINKQRWEAAVKTLKTTEESRLKLDHRAKLASLVGIYIDDDDQSRLYGVDLIVAVQPDRSSGRKLLFIDRVTEESVGFVLLETSNNNTAENNRENENNDNNVSTIRGIKIEEWARGRGYSSLFMSVWLKLCLQGNIVPATVSINKPLLALALCRLGFAPIDPKPHKVDADAPTSTTSRKKKRKRNYVRKTPITIEIRKQTNGEVEIYCDDFQKLEAGFTQGELQSQNLVLMQSPPHPRGETIQIRTSYVPPESYDADSTVFLCGLRLDPQQGKCSNNAKPQEGLVCSNILQEKVTRALTGRLRGFNERSDEE